MINIKNLSEPGLIAQLYNRYYFQDATPDNYLSSYWKNFSSEIKVRLDEDGSLKFFRAYSIDNAQYAGYIHRVFQYLCNLSYFIRLSHKKELLRLIRIVSKNTRSIDFYLTYNCFREACSLALINRHLNVNSDDKFSVMVIGDGHGLLSALIKRLYPKCRILLVDIGKVLFFQCVNLQRIFPFSSHFLVFNDNDPDLEKFDFVYCPAENLEKVNRLRYKLIINIASMQEIPMQIIERYFSYMRKYATADNLFYCCNRLSKELMGGEKINFFSYPWHMDDKHIIDEEPDFYRYSLSPRFPFIQRLDGRVHNRLTNLKIEG